MWLTLRLLGVIAAFILGALFDPMGQFLREIGAQPTAGMSPGWLMPLGVGLLTGLCALLTPLLVLAAVGMQAVSPFGVRAFRRPGWRTSFLDLRDPAHFFHFFGYFTVAAGLGRTLAQLATEGSVGCSGIGWLSGGLGFLLGVRLSMRVYRSRYVEMGDAEPGR